VFPEYHADAGPAELDPLSKGRALLAAAESSFNYSILGAEGFRTAADLVDRCGVLHTDLQRSGRGPGSAQRSDGSRHARFPEQPPRSPARRRRPAHRTTLVEWDLIVRQGKPAGLLARSPSCSMAPGNSRRSPKPRPPPRIRAYSLAPPARRDALGDREARGGALPAAIPVILLKGAAYLASGLPCSRRRMFVDIDLMAPRAALEIAERALHRGGGCRRSWTPTTSATTGDWMHEIPAAAARRAQVRPRVHPHILPPTVKAQARRAQAARGRSAGRGYEDLYVLAPADMVLHSATHLFYDGELNHGLRDLVDLDDLLKHSARRRSAFGLRSSARVRNAAGAPAALRAALRESDLGTKLPARSTCSARGGPE